MKKLFTLCLGLIAALATQAQNEFPLQFADKDGNIIADGSVVVLTDAIVDEAFGDVQIPAHLYVKNISDAAVEGGGFYEVTRLDNGDFQTCFPVTCTRRMEIGEWETGNGTIEAGALKDMQTEWFPTEDGICTVVYQLVTYKQNAITKAWAIEKAGPTITINFAYGAAGINAIAKTTDTVKYFNMQGQPVSNPTRGMFVKKTYLSNGTVQSQKILIR